MSSATQVRSLIERWCKAFVASDVDCLVGMYASDAVFLGTTSPRMLSTTDEIREYFVRATRQRNPKSADVLELQLQDHGALVVANALDRIEWSDSQGPLVSLGRVTFILGRFDHGWRIESFHRSEAPR